MNIEEIIKKMIQDEFSEIDWTESTEKIEKDLIDSVYKRIEMYPEMKNTNIKEIIQRYVKQIVSELEKMDQTTILRLFNNFVYDIQNYEHLPYSLDPNEQFEFLFDLFYKRFNNNKILEYKDELKKYYLNLIEESPVVSEVKNILQDTKDLKDFLISSLYDELANDTEALDIKYDDDKDVIINKLYKYLKTTEFYKALISDFGITDEYLYEFLELIYLDVLKRLGIPNENVQKTLSKKDIRDRASKLFQRYMEMIQDPTADKKELNRLLTQYKSLISEASFKCLLVMKAIIDDDLDHSFFKLSKESQIEVMYLIKKAFLQ